MILTISKLQLIDALFQKSIKCWAGQQVESWLEARELHSRSFEISGLSKLENFATVLVSRTERLMVTFWWM